MTVTAVGFSGPTWVQSPGNGAATTFNFPFLITATTDLVVGFIVGGVYSQQASGYSVSASSVGNSGGGQIIFTTAPPAGTTVDIRSYIPETQPTNFANLGAYYPESTTNSVDRITRLITDLYRLTYQFGIHGPDTEGTVWPSLPPPSQRLGGVLAFDSVLGLPTVGFNTTINLTQSIFNGFLFNNPTFPYPQTANETAAINLGFTNATPVNFQYAEGNVLRYGADPSGLQSSDSAIRGAIAVACASLNVGGVGGVGGHCTVYFPRGQYTVTTTNIFGNPIFPTTIRGIVFLGDGNSSSIIYLKTNGTTTLWAFDGSSTEGSSGSNPGTQNWLTATWSQLGFFSDNASYGNGFRAFTSQGGRFLNCYFNNLYTMFDTEAALGQGFGGDSWLWFYSKATNIQGPAIIFNNSQAFNFHFHACAFEQMTDHIFQVNANGGGGMDVYGGSYIMQGGASSYFLNIVANAVLADSNNRFIIRDVDFSLEQTSVNSGLLQNLGATSQSSRITFDHCTVQQNGVSGANLVVNTQGHVLFKNCALTLSQNGTYTCTGPAANGAAYGDAGSIIFEGCEVFQNHYSFCSTPTGADNLAWGYISARDCYASVYVPSTQRNIRTPVDFDMNWQNAGRCYNPMRLKRMTLLVQNYPWPASGGSFASWITNLPIGAIPVNIELFRPAVAGGSSYSLAIGTQANSAAYGTATGSNTNVNTTFSWNQASAPVNWAPVTSANNQIILTATGGTDSSAGKGGYAYVEYY